MNKNKKTTIFFRLGFKYKGFLYGWYKKELYRISSVSKNRKYGFKKLSMIKVGNNLGYRLVGDKLSILQLVNRTTEINTKLEFIIDDFDLPEIKFPIILK